MSVFLPQDIITEILTRLPVKPLLKFKCVSKSWLSLVSSPRFVKLHLEISSSLPRILLSLYLKPISSNQTFMSCSAHSLFSEPVLDRFENWNGDVIIRGSCNGLILITLGIGKCLDPGYRRDLLLWNPCTRKSQQLPEVYDIMDTIAYEIGYDKSNDDYNVVAVSMQKLEAHIYSLKSNSWKKKQNFKDCHSLCFPCKFAAGKFHMMCNKRYKGFLQVPDFIVSFDIENEDYGVIEPPNYGKDVTSVWLKVLGGCISVICRKNNHADLWIMKEYGVTESWTNMFTFPYGNHELRPLVMLQSREILLRGDFRLVVYNLNDNNSSPRSLGTYDLTRGTLREVEVYVESLVSPNHTAGNNILVTATENRMGCH